MEYLFNYLQDSFIEGLLIALALGLVLGILLTQVVRRRR